MPNTTTAALARELVSILVDGVTPRPTASALAALQATLARQIAAVGPAAAEAAVHRLAAAPGPACIATRRAAFAGIAAALGSAPLGASP